MTIWGVNQRMKDIYPPLAIQLDNFFKRKILVEEEKGEGGKTINQA